MPHPIMAKATAVWLIDNTTLTFKQIADFCGLHQLEVNGIADGDVGIGIKGFNPIANSQLTHDEIKKGQNNSNYQLKLMHNPITQGEKKRRGTRYTPLSKRQDRPASILWLVKFHPELTDLQIIKLVGTTKPTITAIRKRRHWNIARIQPTDPVALGLCKQTELDQAVQIAIDKKGTDNEQTMAEKTRQTLVSTEQSLQESIIPITADNVKTFGVTNKNQAVKEAENLFNLPKNKS